MARLVQVPIKSDERPKYSKEQLDKYFKRIQLPQKFLDSPILTSDPSLALTKEHGLPLLQALVIYHTSHVPFENLELHYSAHKTVTLEMDALFEKFGERGLRYGRGGRCMENNGFFGTVLRSIGYQLRNCAGRVSRMMSPLEDVRNEQGSTYDGWNHMLNLISLDGEWYVADVGMGAMGPNYPYKLEDGIEFESIAPRLIRLQKRAIPETFANGTDIEPPKLWCYDVCLKPDAEERKWIPTYAFTETEFLPQDYEMMSWFTSTNKKTFFTYSIVVTKMLLNDDGDKIVGNITLFNDTAVKQMGKDRETVRECKTEGERVAALKELFDLDLTEEEKTGINSTELKLQS